MRNEYIIDTSQGEQIRVSTYGNSGKILIYVHGFKGFKDWGFVPFAGEYFARSGFFFIAINFSHNGIGADPFQFTELDKFADNTFSLQISELEGLISKCKDGYFQNADPSKIGLIGHSMGGAVSLLTAYGNNMIDAVATWASISKIDRYTKKQIEEMNQKGYYEALNTRTNQLMRINKSMLDDIEKNKSGKLNLPLAVEKLNKPLLIAQGDQDLAVSPKEAETLYSWADKSLTEYLLIAGTGHTFNAKHPFEGTNVKLDKLLDHTKNFFNKHFNVK